MVIERRTKRELADEVERLRARVVELKRSNRGEPLSGALRAALDGVPYGVSISAHGGAIRWANRALGDMLGRPKEQIVGTALYDHWYHGYSESEMDKLTMLWAGQLDVYRYDRLLQRADGKPFWADITTSIVADPDTGERWMLRSLRDASERQLSEKQLRSQREQSLVVLESITEGVCVFRGRQRLFVNRAFVDMLGHSNSAEALKGSSLDFLPEDDRRRIERNEALDAGRRLHEATLRRADGSEVHVVVSIVRTVFDGFPASVAVLRDVTLRMRARLAIESSERRYRSLFDAAPVGIAIVNELAIISDCNAAFAEMACMPVELVRGMSLRNLTKLPPGRTSGRALERIVSGEIDVFDGERLWNVLGSDVEWIEFRNAGVRAPDGSVEYILAILRDITARKHVERQRQELYWKLAESKEEQSRELAKELHDEIGQQLTGLRFQLERDTPAAKTTAIEIVGELMTRVRSLSLDLRPPSLDELGLVAALHSLIQRFSARTGIHVEFIHNGADFDLSPDVAIAAFRIVQEALTNVARHSGADSAMVTLMLDDAELAARIEDSGCGTTRRLGSSPDDEESTGLSGMYERALALGGDLRFMSALGKGTVVEAFLPVAPELSKRRRDAG